jgi:hypothetical protein
MKGIFLYLRDERRRSRSLRQDWADMGAIEAIHDQKDFLQIASTRQEIVTKWRPGRIVSERAR